MTYNPLSVFTRSTYGWNDFQVVKSHLMLPKAYLKIIFRNYPVTLSSVPIDFPVLLNRYHEYLWSKMKIDASKLEIYYKLAGIPPTYIRENRIPDCTSDVLKSWSTIRNGIDRFCGKGRNLYMYSTFQENATLAAAEVMKSAVTKKIPSYMISFVELLDEIKTFKQTDKLAKVDSCDLLCLTMIGAEYINKESGFVESNLDSLLQRRTLAGKTTIMVSAMNPKEYHKRYGFELRGTELQFKDSKLKETLSQILAELEE